jgi:hypothetical protein
MFGYVARQQQFIGIDGASEGNQRRRWPALCLWRAVALVALGSCPWEGQTNLAYMVVFWAQPIVACMRILLLVARIVHMMAGVVSEFTHFTMLADAAADGALLRTYGHMPLLMRFYGIHQAW